MLTKLVILTCFLAVAFAKDPATNVNRCSKGQPFPLEVRVLNCVDPPCNVIKGTSLTFEIDFVNSKYIDVIIMK